jgi:hypothetical protein
VNLYGNEIHASNSHYKNWFFESTPKAYFQKADFVVFSAFGAENNKISFIMETAKFMPMCNL